MFLFYGGRENFAFGGGAKEGAEENGVCLSGLDAQPCDHFRTYQKTQEHLTNLIIPVRIVVVLICKASCHAVRQTSTLPSLLAFAVCLDIGANILSRIHDDMYTSVDKYARLEPKMLRPLRPRQSERLSLSTSGITRENNISLWRRRLL